MLEWTSPAVRVSPRFSVRAAAMRPLFSVAMLAAVTMSGCRKSEPPLPEPPAAPPKSAAQPLPDVGRVERVPVKVTGTGPTLSAALDDALALGIRQVNGQVVASSAVSMQSGVAVSFGDDVTSLSSAGFAQAVATHFQGAVTDFKLLSHRRLDDGSFEADVEASVARFRQPESAGMLRLVVAPLRMGASSAVIDGRRLAAAELMAGIRQALTDGLSQSGRFSLLDREMTAEVEAELALIESGQTQQADLARLGQALAADVILAGVVERFEYVRHERILKTSDRVLVSHSGGARLAYRLVNMTTREIVLSNVAEVSLPATEPTTMGGGVDGGAIQEELVQGLVAQAVSDVIARTFPITVVAVTGDDVVLSQGGKAVTQGRRYKAYLLGQELTDPQTGRSLGRVEKLAGLIEVSRVTADLSYGFFVEKALELPEPMVPGSLEVREEVAVAAPPPVAAGGKSLAKPKVPTRPKAPSSGDSAAKPAGSKDEDW